MNTVLVCRGIQREKSVDQVAKVKSSAIFKTQNWTTACFP